MRSYRRNFESRSLARSATTAAARVARVASLLLVLVAGVAVAQEGMAAAGSFSTASVRGIYAVTATVGANEGAVVGSCTMDGAGGFGCSFTANVPDDAGGRQVFSFTSSGSYTVNADGTGTVHEVEVFADGSSNEVDHDYVITDAIWLGSFSLATELRGVIRQPTNPSGALVTTLLRRLPDARPSAPVDADASVALVKRFYQAMNAADFAAMDAFMAADFVDHNPTPGQAPGLAGLKASLAGLRASIPDFTVTNEAFVVQGEMVVVRSRFAGTQGGEFLGVPPTGRPVEANSIDIWRIENGRLVEAWHVEELLQLLFQIGAF